MLEQELASIIKFILESTGNPAPYYWNIPEDFAVPAAYFPQPDITTAGETFLTYRMDYVWYVKFFHMTNNDAYSLGLQALTAIRGCRNLIPIIDENGEETGKGIRLADPQIKMIDNGVCQMAIRWASRRPYDSTLVDREKMQKYVAVMVLKGE